MCYSGLSSAYTVVVEVLADIPRYDEQNGIALCALSNVTMTPTFLQSELSVA